MNYENRLEYIVYDDIETFALIERKTGYKDYFNKYKIGSLLIEFLNLSNKDLESLESHIGPIKYVLPVNRKPYKKEITIIKKAKRYIDTAMDDPFYANYEIFKLACELKYFKEVTSKQFHDLSLLSREQEETFLNYEFFKGVSYVNRLCKQNNVNLVTAYELKSFEDYIVASMTELFKNKKCIKKCENCGKYFVPKRNDAKYCDNTSPQNENKTCKQYAIDRNYYNKLSEDEATKLYRKIYKRYNKYKERYKDNDSLLANYIKQFEKFKTEVKNKKSQIKSGVITNEEYFNWLQGIDKNGINNS